MKYLFSFFFILIGIYSWSINRDARGDEELTVSITNAPTAPQNSAFNVTITFSEAVSGFEADDIAFSDDSVGASVTLTTDDNTSYTAEVTPTDDVSGELVFQVSENVVKPADADEDAEDNNTASNQVTVEVDNIAPTVEISGLPNTEKKDAFDLTITFSEIVSGFDENDITVNGEATATAVTGTDEDYTVTITPNANTEDDITIQVNAESATDAAGNGNTASAVTDSVRIDTIVPTVSIEVPTGEQNSEFDVTITFSEDVPGFTLSAIEHTGPAMIELKSGTQGPTVYTVIVTPDDDAEDDVTIQVAADAVTDAAQNNNIASNLAEVHIDTIPPTAAISDVPDIEKNIAFDLMITFSEAVNGFQAGDLTLTGPAGASLTSGSDGDSEYIVTITPDDHAEGNVTIQVKANAVKDAALNDNTAPSATTDPIHIDTIAPTIESITGVPDIEKNAAFDLTITFSEAVNDFQVSNLIVTGPATADLKSGSDGDSEYIVTIIPDDDAEGDVTIQVPVGTAQDFALNDNTASAEMEPVHIDTIPPTVEITDVPDIEKNEPFEITITFLEVVNGFTIEDLTVTGPVTAELVSGVDGDSEYIVTITPDSNAEDDVTIQVGAGVVTDFATNDNTASDQVQGRVDTIVPTVEITDVPEDVQLEIFSVTIMFSEEVHEFELEDITFSGDAVVADSELAGTGSTYTLTITPHEDTDGDVTVEVPAGVAEDAATNPTTGSVPQTVSVAPKWIPDPNIRIAIRRALGLAVDEDFSKDSMLDLRRLNADGFGINDLTGLEYATNLIYAELNGNEIVDISPLNNLTRLRTLNLGSNSIVDVSPLKDLLRLESLTLANNSIAEILPLSGLTNIITLDLRNNDITDISALADFALLTHLDLTNNQIDDVSPIVSLENLEMIRVSGNPILDVRPLAGLAAVIEVEGEIPELISDPGLAAAIRQALDLDASTDITIASLQQLTTLEAAPSNIRALVGLEYATALTTLKISRNVITDLTPIADLTHLTTLELNDNAIRNLTPLTKLTNLTTLDLSSNAITDLRPLSNLTKLRTLKLNSNSISNLSSVGRLVNLTTLEVANNALEDLTSLSVLRKLTTLKLSGNAISDLTPIAGMVTLTILDFSSNAIENVDVLAGLTGVTLLNLDGNLLSDLNLLAELTRLTTLKLSNNAISDLSPIASLRNLTVLTLNATGITDLSVISGLTQLSTLAISDNAISDFTPLANFTHLKVLNLSGNSISDLNFLIPLTLLRTLDLTHNDIIDVQPISGLEDLLILRLAGNPILDTTALYPLTERVPPVDIDIAVSEFRPWDVNADGSVNAADVALVIADLSQTGDDIIHPRTDINGDGTVDNADLLLVNEHLDDAAASPISTDMPTLLDKTCLLANYPNPFNPETWIPYHLATDSDVQIIIYDARGIVVRRLDLGHQREGYYTTRSRAAHWDGKNVQGECVASGIYFYRLQTDNVSLLRKMVILK